MTFKVTNEFKVNNMSFITKPMIDNFFICVIQMNVSYVIGYRWAKREYREI